MYKNPFSPNTSWTAATFSKKIGLVIPNTALPSGEKLKGLSKKFFAKDGFIHTGDLASYAKNGMLKYEGRLKELIK